MAEWTVLKDHFDMPVTSKDMADFNIKGFLMPKAQQAPQAQAS